MKLKMTDSRWAALIYALAALAPIGMWIILLFVAIPENQTLLGSATSTILFLFSSENSNRWWFVGWTVIPFFLLALSLAYLSSITSQYKGRQLLFIAATVATIYSSIFIPPLGFVLLPALYLSYRSIKNY
jgi:hypothetical protein